MQRKFVPRLTSTARRNNQHTSQKRAAFTLVELIVVLAILAVLLVVVVPRVTGYVGDARQTAAKSNAAAILRAAELYIVEQERDGETIPASLSTGGPLDAYIDNLDDEDSYSLTISVSEDGSQYDITGTYTSGTITVSIPEMTTNTDKETPAADE